MANLGGHSGGLDHRCGVAPPQTHPEQNMPCWFAPGLRAIVGFVQFFRLKKKTRSLMVHSPHNTPLYLLVHCTTGGKRHTNIQ